MASVLELLNDIDLTKLTATLNAARLTVSVDGSTDLRSIDPRDLLGDLGQILKSPEAFGIEPAQIAESVANGLGELDLLVQLPSIPVLGDVSAGLEDIIGRLEDAVTQFGLGSGEIDLDALLPEFAGFDTIFEAVIKQVLDAVEPQIPEHVANLLKGLGALAGGDPSNGQELARTLTAILFGFDLDALRAPAEHLNDLIGGVRTAGGNLEVIEREIVRLTAECGVVVDGLRQSPIDVPLLQARLARVRGDFGLLVHNTLPGAAARLATDLEGLNLDRLAADLRARLRPLAETTAALPFDFERELLAPFRALATQVDALTPERLDELFRSVEKDFEGLAEGLGTQPLLNGVDELFDVVIELMRDIPLRRMREDLFDALNAIEARIRNFEGFAAPDAIGARVRELGAKLDAVDVDALQQRVAQFSARIKGTIDAFPVNDVRQEVTRVSEAVADAVGAFVPALEELSKQVDDLADRLGTSDFSQAGQGSVAQIADIRQKVESVVSSDDVPDAVRAAIGAAAAGLKNIEFKVAITEPFDELLASVDVSAVTAPLEGVIGRVRESLETVTPQAIIDELEPPYEHLLADLQRLRPQALVAGLSQEFQRLLAEVDKLRPETLVAPLDAEFKRITAALRSAVDPAPLFAPLRVLHQKLLELVDLLDMEKVFGKIHERIVGLPSVVGERMHGTLTQRVGAGTSIETEPAGADFEWGDFLRPFAILVAQVRARVQQLAESVLRDGFAMMQGPLRVLAQFAEGAGDLTSRIADALDERRRALDLFTRGGAAEELRVAINELQAAAASAAISGQAGIEIGGHIAAIRADLTVHAGIDVNAQLLGHQARFSRAVGAPDLSDLLHRVATHVRELVPKSFLEGDATAAVSQVFASLFDAVDLGPVVDELDAIGVRVRTKLQGFLTQIMNALLKLWTRLFDATLAVTPRGMVPRVQQGMKRVRAEFAVLDPAPIEQEVREIVDAVVDGLERFSPASLAAQLNGLFDPLKQKLQQLDPAALLGDLTPIDAVIEEFEGLRPSTVLAPLISSTADLKTALDRMLTIDFGAALESVIAKLRAQLEAVVADVQKEFEALLSFLESLAGGSVSVTVSV